LATARADNQFGADAELAARLDHYRGAAFAIAFDRLGSRHDAEDVTQEALTRAWASRDTIQRVDALPGWLRTTVVNLCADRLRRTRELPMGVVVEGPATESAAASVSRRHAVRELRRALRELPENNRLALMLHAIAGYSYADIASILSVPITTVEGRIHRARARLRARMVRHLGDLLGHEGE